MASVSGASADRLSASSGSGKTVAGLIDRWIYVFMAGLFLVTVLAGFVPDSIAKVAAVQAGQRPPFPLVLHVHAVLMGCWLLLLLAQTSLMATGRPAPHRKLGLASMVLAPAIVVVGIVLVPAMYRSGWDAIHAAPPAIRPALEQGFTIASNLVLFQIRVGILFPILLVLALRARRTDPGLHKRLMILATLMPLPAAITRIQLLPATLPTSPISIDLYALLWISPMFVWDLVRLGRVHRAYLIWFGLNLPFAVAANLLWGSPWWLATVPRLMGVAG